MTTTTQLMREFGLSYGEALTRLRAERADRASAKTEHARRVAASPITAAVAPLKEDAMKAATEWAEKKISFVAEELAKVEMDRERAAPYPRASQMSRHDWHVAKARYQLFRAVTKGRKSSLRMHEADPCDMDPQGMARFTEDAREAAAFQYEQFVSKLVHKIGDVTAATLEGNHVWSHSILSVTKPDGTVERWKTQQITNVSKLGKYFPQWPSRKVKK